MTDPAGVHDAIAEEVGTVLIGNDRIVERLSVSLLTGGNVLLEGVPGVAKTTLAALYARASGLSHTRIQMTPDVLPADITGTHVYREGTGEFSLQKGPVFANLVVADEINRATPKTQSALLEAMQEGNVTIEGETLALPSPFMVVATQNPLEMEGVFELPEAQRDRFQFKLVMDVPNREEERSVLDRFDEHPDLEADAAEQVVTVEEIVSARAVVADVHVADAVREYILDVVRSSRGRSDIEYGGSPRASLALLQASKALAAIRGRDYVVPDDVKELVPDVLRHRLVLSTDAELGGEDVMDVIDSVLASVTPPGGDPEGLAPEAASD